MFLIKWFQPFSLTVVFFRKLSDRLDLRLPFKTLLPICFPKTGRFYFPAAKKTVETVFMISFYPR
jgi:hypothetical protein